MSISIDLEDRALIDILPVSTLILGEDGTIKDCNKSTLSMFHASERDKIVGQRPNIIAPIYQMDGSDSGKKIDSLVHRAKERGIITFNWINKRLDGEEFPAKVTLTVADYKGETCIVCCIDDITGHVQAEEINAIIGCNPYGILSLKPDLTIKTVNPAFSKISGFVGSEWIGRKISELEVLKRAGPTVSDAVSKKQPVRGNYVVRFPSGIKHLEYSYIPVFDSDGNLLIIYEVFSDITHLIEEIQESTALIAENPALILTSDPEGRLLTVNQAYINVSGLSREKILTMNIDDIKVISRTGGIRSELLITKKPVKGRVTLEFEGKEKIFEYVYIPVTDVSDNIVKIVMMYSDVTANRKIIEYLKSSIEELVKDLAYLAAGNTTFDVKVLEGDSEVSEAHEQFVKIYAAVETAKHSIARVVADSKSVADAVINGELSYRVDESVHQGDFRDVIKEMNQTLNYTHGPIIEAMRVSNEYATRNFSIRTDRRYGVKGDWMAFGNALDEIGDRISEVMKNISGNVSNLLTNTTDANSNVDINAKGAVKLAEIAGRVSDNAQQSNLGVQRILSAMEDLAITVGDVSRRTEEVSTLAHNANDLTKDGENRAKKAENGMKVITTSAGDMTRLIGEIQQEMGRIGKIVHLITDIANQTNLLALNAAIEAARAGDAGRGFAVVASEVKTLATESRSSAESINEMITTLQKKSEEAKHSADIGGAAIKEGNEALIDTLAAFTKVSESVENISMNIEQVAAMSEEQTASTQEISSSIGEIGALLDGNSKEAEQISEISKDSAEALEKLQTIINKVNYETKGVADAISEFKV